jgi:hypothetical protein
MRRAPQLLVGELPEEGLVVAQVEEERDSSCGNSASGLWLFSFWRWSSTSRMRSTLEASTKLRIWLRVMRLNRPCG